MVAALDAPGAADAVLDLPGGETLAYRDMVRRIFRGLGRRPVLVYLPLRPARLAFRAWLALTGASYSIASLERMNMDLTLDPAPANDILGMTGRPFRPVFPAEQARAPGSRCSGRNRGPSAKPAGVIWERPFDKLCLSRQCHGKGGSPWRSSPNGRAACWPPT